MAYSAKEFKKYGSDKELDKLVDSEDWQARLAAIKQSYGLDKLVNDKLWRIRQEVAKRGYGLDKLINDNEWAVIREVARQGYGLDKLITYRDDDVREIVACKLDGKTIAEWWESAPKKSRYYKDVKSMPERLQTTFAVVAADMALGGERIVEREMRHACGCKRSEKVLMDVTHSYGNGFSIRIHFFQISDKYTITLGFPDSVWGDIKAEFSDAGELISLLRSAKSRVPGASEEFTQALSKAINAIEGLIS